MNQPLVTVNILSYNRKDDLRITLQKVFEQDYKNIEVIVVDNNSTDGTVEMAKNEFPSVQLIELKKNIGIAGWNEGFKAAKGEYVLVLDDDSYPLNGSINNALARMKLNNKFAVVALNIINSVSNKSETEGFYFPENNLSFIGCGAILKKSIFEIVGGFNSDLFIYVHEREYCIRLINMGYEIGYEHKAIIYHNYSIHNRQSNNQRKYNKRQQFYDTRNILFILYLYFPLPIAFDRISRVIASKLLFGLIHGLFIATLRGIVSFIFLALKTHRTPISKLAVVRYGNGKYIAGFFSNGRYSFPRAYRDLFKKGRQ